MIFQKNHSLIQFFLIVSSCVVLSACQTTPQQKNQNKVTVQGKEQPLKTVRLSRDGVQDLRWEMIEIKQKKAATFVQQPSLRLNANSGQVTGSTGCNALVGKYKIDTTRKSLDFNVKAGFQSCTAALAQEANLMEVLQDVTRFELKGKQLWLYDRSGRIVIKAQQ